MPRFSLATLLLVTTIVAMGITITLLMREIGPLRAEVKKLREETGQLWIEDETKIHAIQMPKRSEEDGSSRYRIYLPPGRSYLLNYATNNIPNRDIPIGRGDQILESGEYIVTLDFNSDVRQLERGAATLSIDTKPVGNINGGRSTSIGFQQLKTKWISDRDKYASEGGSLIGLQTTTVHDPNRKLLITSRRANELVVTKDNSGRFVSSTSKSISEPTDGYMVWIEPVK